MKKRILCIMLVFLISTLIVSCGKSDAVHEDALPKEMYISENENISETDNNIDESETEATPYDSLSSPVLILPEVKEGDGKVSIEVVEKDTAGNRMVYRVTNNSERMILIGHAVTLEKYKEDNWRVVEPKEFWFVSMEGIKIKQGSAYEDTLLWDGFSEPIIGKYRLVKNYTMDGEEFVIRCEFESEPTDAAQE